MDINKAAIDNHKQKHSHKPTDIYIGAYYPWHKCRANQKLHCPA
jgi:hypothetical protein